MVRFPTGDPPWGQLMSLLDGRAENALRKLSNPNVHLWLCVDLILETYGHMSRKHQSHVTQEAVVVLAQQAPVIYCCECYIYDYDSPNSYYRAYYKISHIGNLSVKFDRDVRRAGLMLNLNETEYLSSEKYFLLPLLRFPNRFTIHKE